MIKTLQERKQEIIDWCTIEYADKQSPWWKSNKIKYTSTLEYSPPLNNFEQTLQVIVVKLSYKENTILSIIFFGLSIFVINGGITENYSIMLLSFGVLTVYASLHYFVKIFDKKPRILLNIDGIWTNKKAERIAWQNIIATYIKIEDKGEDTAYYLVIHYYEYLNDSFRIIEYKLENLNMNIEEICFHIEKFKEKNSRISTP
jgi:hypothetical protein